MAGNPEVEIVLHQRVELDAQKATLGQQGAVLLDDGEEMGRCGSVGVGENDRLATQGATLGAADVEHVAQVGQLLQGHIAALGHQAVAQTGTVDEQRQVVVTADVADGLQFLKGINRAHLGGKGDIDHAREHHVLVGDVGIEVMQPVAQLGDIHLAVV